MLEKTNIASLSVSKMAFGAMYLGTKTDADTSYALLDAYVDQGGNFIDTANNYAFWIEGGRPGDSEKLLGRWLAQRGGNDDLVIATKVGACPTVEGTGLETAQGLSRKVIIEGVEKSLKNLGIETIGLYYAHVDDRIVGLEETLSAFDTLVKAGKVREIACSNYRPWRLEEARAISVANGLAEFAAIQSRHSYFQPSPGQRLDMVAALGRRGAEGIEDVVGPELIDYARSHPGFRVVAYSPLIQGGLADPARLVENYRTPNNDARRVVLEAVAQETGMSVNQVVLAWMMQSPVQAIPLVAASGLGQLKENLAAASMRLSDEHMTRLDRAV